MTSRNFSALWQRFKLLEPSDLKFIRIIDPEVSDFANPISNSNLAYISPEQTGRMNRGIDRRSDFYSLGITFYELFVGQLPFQSVDPMELVQ